MSGFFGRHGRAMKKRNSRPPTPEEIEETNHRDWGEKYRHDAQYLEEYRIPGWVWERLEKEEK
jgi:hypothetical protein